MKNNDRKCYGFTLLEMLVVLLLSSLVTMLLLQGLQHVFRLQRNFGAEQFSTQQGAMQVAWFRQSINGLMPEYPDGNNKFRGDTRQLQGLTVAALDAPDGTLVHFQWQLNFDPKQGRTLLKYGRDEKASTIMAWEGNGGGFRYLDANAEAHDEWPPFLGQWPQLPTAILLETRQASGGKIIVASPRGPVNTMFRLKDLERL